MRERHFRQFPLFLAVSGQSGRLRRPYKPVPFTSPFAEITEVYYPFFHVFRRF